MGNHLERQDGVEDAKLRAGTIELKSGTAEGFEIGELLATLENELGFAPIKEIEATLRGRILSHEGVSVFEVAGTGERLEVDGLRSAEEGEQVLRGTIEVDQDGHLKLEVSP